MESVVLRAAAFLGLEVRSLAKFAVESDFDFVLLSASLIKGLAFVKGWRVDVERDGPGAVTWILHTMKACKGEGRGEERRLDVEINGPGAVTWILNVMKT